MKRNSIFFAGILFFSVACKNRDAGNSGLKIVGGTVTPTGSDIQRSTVAIATMDEKMVGQEYKEVVDLPSCTGTIIGSRTILTAAHCVMNDSMAFNISPRVEVIFGFGAEGSQEQRVRGNTKYMQGASIGPAVLGENNYIRNDLAIISLDQSIPAGYVPVPLAAGSLVKGNQVILAGHGFTGEQQDQIDKTNRDDQKNRARIMNRVLEIMVEGSVKLPSKFDPLAEKARVLAPIYGKIRDARDATGFSQTELNNMNSFYQDPLLNEAEYYLYEHKLDQTIVDIYQDIRVNSDIVQQQQLSSLRQTSTTVDSFRNDGKVIVYRSSNNINSACKGDSGGPMYQRSSTGDLIVVGVTSGADAQTLAEVGSCKRSGIYTSVFGNLDWIRGELNASETGRFNNSAQLPSRPPEELSTVPRVPGSSN